MPPDFRIGIRLLLRNPGFTAITVTALALGIGATSAIFSVVYGVLIKPLPYQNPERLVRVYASNPVERFRQFGLSPADFLDYRKQNRVFSDITVFVRQDQQYGGEPPARLMGMRVSEGFFRVFGVQPALGRTFTPEEESKPGAVDVCIISHSVWSRLLNGDPQVIGRTIRLSGDPFRIVGVMPSGFDQIGGASSLPRDEAVGVWLPFNLLGNPKGAPRAFHYGGDVARLKPGIGIESAQSDMNVLASQLEAQYPDDKNWRVELRPLQDDLVGESRPTLLILAGAVAFVLLIACVNVANLLLARSAVRQREMAIRTALGASRGRLVRQMLTESLVLAAVGGGFGLLLAQGGIRLVVSLGPQQAPRLESIGLDAPVVLVAVAATLLSGLFFGLAPALSASTGIRHNRPRAAFVVAEIALSFVLLTGAGLLLRTFVAIGHVAPGFQPNGVLTMSTALSYSKLVGARRYAAFYEQFIENLRRLPGVTAAGAGSKLPWSGGRDSAFFGIAGRPRHANASMHAHYEFVTPDYLRTIGVPLLAGRWLTEADNFDAPKVVLINKRLALQYWTTVKDSLGQQIHTLRDSNTPEPPMTIAGVVGDVKDNPTDADAAATFYTPFLQSPSFGNYVVLRANSEVESLIPAAREVALKMGNDLSVQEIRTLDSVVASAVAEQKFALQTIGIFAIVALVLALTGIYGVMSYSTASRRREIAIRAAIGATRADTLRLLLGEGTRWIVAGLITGALAAVAVTRVLTSVLFQVSPTDSLTFAVTALGLAVVALLACWLPTRKVLDTNPMEVLRHE